MSKRAILTELLKQRANVRSYTELLYSVHGAAALRIPLAGSRALCIQRKHFSRHQELFVGDLQVWITLARNVLWR